LFNLQPALSDTKKQRLAARSAQAQLNKVVAAE
jgi:hypothetical protein